MWSGGRRWTLGPSSRPSWNCHGTGLDADGLFSRCGGDECASACGKGRRVRSTRSVGVGRVAEPAGADVVHAGREVVGVGEDRGAGAVDHGAAAEGGVGRGAAPGGAVDAVHVEKVAGLVGSVPPLAERLREMAAHRAQRPVKSGEQAVLMLGCKIVEHETRALVQQWLEAMEQGHARVIPFPTRAERPDRPERPAHLQHWRRAGRGA